MLFLCIGIVKLSSGYQVFDPEEPELAEDPAVFEPYEPGFVGRKDDPDNPRRFRVNEGNSFTQTQPNVFAGVAPRRAFLPDDSWITVECVPTLAAMYVRP